MNRDDTYITSQVRCLWCGQLTTIVWVHGHGQCARCGTNVDECCRGETCTTGNPSDQETQP